MEAFSAIGCLMLFWIVLICAFIENTSWIVNLSVLLYSLGTIYILWNLFEGSIKKKLLIWILLEAVLIIPYITILILKGVL